MLYESIHKNRDFTRIYKKGKSLVHKDLVIYYQKSNRNKIRVGIVASKKIGNAVKRNRARRVIRHAMEHILPNCSGFYDFIFVARGKTVYLKSTQIEKTLLYLLNREGIFKEKSE